MAETRESRLAYFEWPRLRRLAMAAFTGVIAMVVIIVTFYIVLAVTEPGEVLSHEALRRGIAFSAAFLTVNAVIALLAWIRSGRERILHDHHRRPASNRRDRRDFLPLPGGLFSAALLIAPAAIMTARGARQARLTGGRGRRSCQP